MRNCIIGALAALLTVGVAQAQPGVTLPQRIEFLTVHGEVEVQDGEKLSVQLPDQGGTLSRDLVPAEVFQLRLLVRLAMHDSTREASSVFLQFDEQMIGLDMQSASVERLVKFLVKARDSLRKRYPAPSEIFLTSRSRPGGPTRAIAVDPQGRARLFFALDTQRHWELPGADLSQERREAIAHAVSSWRENGGAPAPHPLIKAYPDGTYMKLTICSGPSAYSYKGINATGSLPWGCIRLADELEKALEGLWVYRRAPIEVQVRAGVLASRAKIVASDALTAWVRTLGDGPVVLDALVKTDETWALALDILETPGGSTKSRPPARGIVGALGD